MIDPKQFREGNLFKWADHASMGFGECVITPSNHYNYPDLRNPIELTEDWLVKFGHEKKNEDLANDNIDYVGKSQYWVQHQIDFDDYVLYGRNNSLGISLKYVHTFQNLIFALTQKELEIKG